MAFSGFGGGGFGSNNNQQQQQGTGFGGFGASGTGTTGTGFGSSTPQTGFGAPAAATSNPFGSTTGGFGSSGGFGTGATNTASPFGAAASSGGGGLFGSTTATSGIGGGFGGGFGANANNAQTTSSPFGGGAGTSGGLFGSSLKTGGFGSSTTGTATGGFGNTAASTGFGGTGSTTSAFGAPASTALTTQAPQVTNGTGQTPFQPFVEKDSVGSQTNHFQTISFMNPYQGFSLEELRLADYVQGRRYGNGSNQAGAFGTNTGFGTGFGASNPSTGFGTSTTGGLFGSGTANNTNTTGFGGTQQAANPFGNSNASNPFGPKPASTGLFGSTPASSTQQSGSLFQTASNNTPNAFGGSTAGGFGTGGGIFGGAAQNNNQPKPAFGGFGTTAANTGTGFGGGAATTGGFGQAGAATGTGIFGQAASTPAFGQQQQQQPQQQTTSLFGGLGQNSNQQQNQTQGLFGQQNNQPKPNPFGATTTQSSFGAANTANNQQGSSIFGGTANNNNTGGIFGKPFAPAGTGLGTTPANTNTGGLFAGLGQNNQPQQNQNSIFGNAQNQAPKPSIFGNLGGNAPASTGTGLFGNSLNNNQQQPTGSIFGNSLNTQQPTGGFATNSLFATPQQNQQNQQPQGLTTSITDIDPFGSAQLFQNLSMPTPENMGPIATPLSSSQKMRKSVLLPQYKVNPAASSRLVTPQRRQGYGFSYSTYGTPGSISSVSSTPLGTPMGSMSGSMLGGSLLGGSFGRGLGKSLSTSNLRRNFDNEDSVLAPNAFSASSGRYSNDRSMTRLVINRSVRSDLFSTPTGRNESAGALPAPEHNEPIAPRSEMAKKSVSFDSSTTRPLGSISSNIFNRSEGLGSGSEPTAEEQGFLRSSTLAITNSKSNGISNNTKEPEMEQAKGKELAIVPEDGTPPAPASRLQAMDARPSHDDQPMGEYWTKPPLAELKRLPRERLKHFSGLQVGREGCGHVTFDAPVDLTMVDLDTFCGTIVDITTRSCTVYPDNVSKPPVGRGLNVPSSIKLFNSWPRGRKGRSHSYATSGRIYDKHIERLMRVGGTNFQGYDPVQGIWTFTVDHFTTYGLDYDEEDDFEESELSPPPDSPTPSRGPRTRSDQGQSQGSDGPRDTSMLSEFSGNDSTPDDTFAFKRKIVLPGAFDGQEAFEEEDSNADEEESQSFLDERSVGSPSDSGVDEPSDEDANPAREGGSVMIEDHEMTGSFPRDDDTTELSTDLALSQMNGADGSVLVAGLDTPPRLKLALDGDWADHLQRTVSPKKQDRRALREVQADVLQDVVELESPTNRAKNSVFGGGKGFTTSIDLMNSLFGQEKSAQAGHGKSGARKGFEYPYAKRPSLSDEAPMAPKEKEFHSSNKPSWTTDGRLAYVMPHRRQYTSEPQTGILVGQKGFLASHGKDLRFAKFQTNQSITKALKLQRELTNIGLVDDVPSAHLHDAFDFEEFAERTEGTDPTSIHERLVWDLATVLFDNLDRNLYVGASDETYDYIEERIRKDRLVKFWSKLTQNAAMQQAFKAESKEEEAIAYLSSHQIVDACGALLEGRDYRLATLMAMIGGDKLMRQDMEEQIQEWRQARVLSELSEPVRALYELLAGNTCISEGHKGSMEDSARTFIISHRFKLDWMRSFGLRLWYGTLEEDPIRAAVQSYDEDIAQHREEHALPVPYYVEQGLAPLWEDKAIEKRQDLLWGILKLYAKTDPTERKALLADVLMPQNHERSPLDFRLAWQLYQTLSTQRLTDFPAEGEPKEPNERIARLTLDFAWQLETGGHWLWALFVKLHLKDPDQRKRAIQDSLAAHPGEIGDDPDAGTRENPTPFWTLTKEFLIPEPWIWEAKALHARSALQDHVKEVEYLLRAHNWPEAHATLCRAVAPRAVIEEGNQLAQLDRLLRGFADVDLVPGWALGGGVYWDYLRLLELTRPSSSSTSTADLFAAATAPKQSSAPHKQKGLPQHTALPAVLARLVAALPEMTRRGNTSAATTDRDRDSLTFHERVAATEMSAVVAKAVGAAQSLVQNTIPPTRILALPLTEDRSLRHAVELAGWYYRAVMGGE